MKIHYSRLLNNAIGSFLLYNGIMKFHIFIIPLETNKHHYATKTRLIKNNKSIQLKIIILINFKGQRQFYIETCMLELFFILINITHQL